MTGQTTGLALVGAGLAAATSGPVAEVFNEMALVLAIMGAGGGATRALALRVPWRDGLRGTVLGALLATGIGVLLPNVLGPWLGADTPATVPALAACAYLAGFLQDTLVSRLRKEPKP